MLGIPNRGLAVGAILVAVGLVAGCGGSSEAPSSPETTSVGSAPRSPKSAPAGKDGGAAPSAGDRIKVGSGAVLQDLVNASIAAGLEGLHTMTGIPGWVGGAIYGNAGAYGHSVHEFLETVRFWDGAQVREFTNAECEFRYRESIFKRHKEWVVLNATFRLPRSADAVRTKAEADRILQIRNEKFPPTMKCAGSIFKNLLLAELPAGVQMQVPDNVVREGKVAAAYFLEQVGAKGMFAGGIRVADYHANLIYNTGDGTAAQVRHLIQMLKDLVFEHFGIHLEEEVQFI